jgi:hypothetical protein
MHKVIEALKTQVAQEAERLRKRGVMIEIVEEAVKRLALEGFAPDLSIVEGSLVVLRFDTGNWALREAFLTAEIQSKMMTMEESGAAWAVPPAPPLRADREENSGSPVTWDVGPAQFVAKPKAPASGKGGLAGDFTAFWTPERDTLALRLRAEGLSAAEIAEQVGTSLKAVHNRFSKLKRNGVDVPLVVRQLRTPFAVPSTRVDGVVLRAWTDEDDARIIKDYAAGGPLSDLAVALGRSHSALTKRITALRREGRIVGHRGIVPLDNKWSEEKHAQLARLWKIMPVTQIAKEMGLSTGAVSGMAHRRKLGPAFRAPVVAAPVEQKSEPKVEAVAPVPESTPAPMPAPDPVAVAAVVAAPAPLARPSPGFVSAAARPMTVTRVPVRLSSGMTPSERLAAVQAHVAQLPDTPDFDAEADLELCEAVFGGKNGLQLFATNFGIDGKVALARFDAIVAPFRQPGSRVLPLDTSALLLPALRDRVKASRGVAA